MKVSLSKEKKFKRMWKNGEETAAFFLTSLTDHSLSVLQVYITVKNKNSISKVQQLSSSTTKKLQQKQRGGKG